MRRQSRRRRGTYTTALLAVGVLVVTLAGPVMADSSTPGGDSTVAGDQPDGSTQAAQQKAQETGQPVVVDALTTETSQTTALPDGSFALTTNAQPVRVRKGDAWKAVDATLTANADGSYSPTATPSSLTLSGGGTGPLATVSDDRGHLLSYTLPFPLPTPTVQGDTALYDDVLPGVDLRTKATDQGGFSEVLIVEDAAAAADPQLRQLRLTTTTQGLTVSADAAGNITAKATDGSATYASPAPRMWDSSSQATGSSVAASRPTLQQLSADATDDDDPNDLPSSADGPGAGAQIQPIAVDASDSSLTLTPDADLLTGPGTTYPLYLDPFTNPTNVLTGGYVEVQEYSGCADAHTWNVPQDGGEGVGYQQYTTSCFGLERSYYQMDTSHLDSRMIIGSATLNLTETDGADHDCSHTWPVTLKATSGVGPATTWNNQPNTATTIRTSSVKSAYAPCGDQGLNFDVTSQIDAAAGVKDTWTFGLFGDEQKTTSNLGFMRFATNPSIYVVFDIPPNQPGPVSTTPDSINPNGSACGGGTSGWIGKTSLKADGTSNIMLNAKVTTDMAGTNLKGEFAVWDNQTDDGTGGSTFSTPADSPYVASGQVVHTALGIRVYDGHQYGWRVRAFDGYHAGAWQTDCHFNVDLTAPSLTQIDSSSGFPPLGSKQPPTLHAGDEASVHVTSTDPTPDGCTLNTCLKSGIWKFEFSLDTPISPVNANSVVATPDASGTAQANIPIGVPAQQWGAHTLYVQAVDKAGNAQATTYSFYAPWNPDTKVTAGDVDGDGIPDLVSPAADGNLYLVPGNSDVSAAPKLASYESSSPDGKSWSNYLVTHRGSTNQSGVDDLLAFNTQTKIMYVYRNIAVTDANKQTQYFTSKAGDALLSLTDVPPCNSLSDCTGYNTTSWGALQQILAVGGPSPTDPPNLITIDEHGRLWYYRGSSEADLMFQNAVLLGTGDWSDATLIAPGNVGGTPTLWARDNTTGSLHTYPLAFGANGLPTTQLTPPAAHTLPSVLKATDGSALCTDVQGAVKDDGTPVQIYTCNSHTSQEWTLGLDDTVHALGKCLDAAGGATANGTLVQLWTCNGHPSQKWQPGAHGSLAIAGTTQCLADPAAATTPGTQLILFACDGGTEQNWTGSATGTLPAQAKVLPIGIDSDTYPQIASPADVNSPSGDPDGNPDLYAVSPVGQYTEFPGQAPATNGVAQFAAPVLLGNANTPTDRWHLDSTAEDPALGNNDLTTYGSPAFTTNAGRSALSLNGTGQYAATAKSVLTTNSRDGFTISALVKLNGTTANSTFVSQSDSAGLSNGAQLYYSSGAHTWAFNRGNADDGGADFSVAYGPTTGDAAPAAGVWTHLTGVYDARSETVQLYVGDRLVSSAGYTGADWNATGPLQIGRRLYQGSYGEYANGWISDVETFNQALTPAGVSALNGDVTIPTQLS